MTQATALFRLCEGCDKPLPHDAHPNRKRHAECAYAKILASNRASRKRLYQPVERALVKCSACPAQFEPPQGKGLVSPRCPDCRAAHKREWKRKDYQANRAAPDSRPCQREGCSNRVLRSGKVYPKFCSDECKPRCSVNECDGPTRKKGWCAAHYSQWQRTGEVKPFTYKHAEKRELCLSCNQPFEMDGYREFCNAACRAYWFAHKGELPTFAHCIHCFKEMPLGKVDGKQRRQRFDIKTCRRCRQDLRKHGLSAEQLAARDGATCQLCDGDVDMTLRAPDPGCPSVDHKIPVSKGGTNDPANLQLTHLRCNILKHDTLYEEYVLAA